MQSCFSLTFFEFTMEAQVGAVPLLRGRTRPSSRRRNRSSLRRVLRARDSAQNLAAILYVSEGHLFRRPKPPHSTLRGVRTSPPFRPRRSPDSGLPQSLNTPRTGLATVLSRRGSWATAIHRVRCEGLPIVGRSNVILTELDRGRYCRVVGKR